MQRKHERVIQYLENYFIARFARLQQIVVVFTCQRKTYYIHMYVFVCLSMKSPTSSSSSSSLSARINKEKKKEDVVHRSRSTRWRYSRRRPWSFLFSINVHDECPTRCPREIPILSRWEIETTGLQRARLVTKCPGSEKYTRFQKHTKPVVVCAMRDHFMGLADQNHRTETVEKF